MNSSLILQLKPVRSGITKPSGQCCPELGHRPASNMFMQSRISSTNGREDVPFVFSSSITYRPSLFPLRFDQKALASPEAPDHLINPNG